METLSSAPSRSLYDLKEPVLQISLKFPEEIYRDRVKNLISGGVHLSRPALKDSSSENF